MTTDWEALRLKIRAQIESLEKGLGWLKDGTLGAAVFPDNGKRGAELIGCYERSIAMLKAMLAELG